MANFTSVELKRISETDEFKTFLASEQAQNQDINPEDALRAYVSKNETKLRAEIDAELAENNPTQTDAEAQSDEPWRERSANSDTNDYIFDKAKLQILLDMEIINQEVYDAAIQNPSAAIEALSQKLPLSNKQQEEFETRLGSRMIEDDELFQLLPPAMLAKQYTALHEQLAAARSKSENADVNTEVDKINKLAARMDELSANLYEQQNLYYADITNISDTYDGYMQMFDAREAHLQDDEEGRRIKEINSANRMALNEIIGEYDDDHNLNINISAEELDSRFDKLSTALDGVSPDEDTLQLVSNFKFLDENGNPEPQFVDKDGNKKDTYQQGDKIIEGSKLDNMVRIAKHNILLDNLGSETEISAENLNAELKDELPEVLYAAHVANRIEQGIAENPKQFTDRAYLDDFIKDLSNVEKPMSVSPTAYNSALDSSINGVAAYAHRLGGKIGKDKPVVLKIFKPLEDLDKRAADRMTKGADKRKVRLAQLKRMAVSGLSAFAVSGAVTVVGTAAAADASLTAATLGLNKYAGMALGGAMAIGMTCMQIKRWRKEQKNAGKPRGLKAFVKDRRMMMTVGTTALGCAALGFAATGNPAVAQYLGMGALALGAANSAVNSYQEVKKAGLGGMEAVGWAALQTAVTIGSGFAGRYAGNAFVDAINAHNPENEIFQRKVEETHIERTTEIGYKEGTIENAQKILDSWYKDNPDLLQQRIDAVNAYNAEHGTNINPQRYLLAAHDSGALSADNNLLHVQDGPDVHTHGNHKVFGAGWSHETGVSQDMVNSLADSVGADGVKITPESIAAFQKIDTYISDINQVGYVPDTSFQNDGVLGFNAETGADGRAAYSQNGSEWRTYADHGGAQEVKIIENEVTTTRFERGEFEGLGMFGVIGRKLGLSKLKDRAGALADKIFGRKNTIENLPPVEDIKIIEDKPDPKPIVAPKVKEDNSQELLDKEYKIVHGIEPDKAEQIRYRGLVQKEWIAEGQTTDLPTYLATRMNNFENMIGVAKEPLAETHDGLSDKADVKDDINKARERMWQLPQGENGTRDMTLLGFQDHMAKCLSNDGQLRAEVSRSHIDPAKAPVGKLRENASAR